MDFCTLNLSYPFWSQLRSTSKVKFYLFKNKSCYFDIRKEGWQKKKKRIFPTETWVGSSRSTVIFHTFPSSLEVKGTRERVCLLRCSFFDQLHSLWRMEYWIPFAVRLCLSAFESVCSLWTLWNMSIPPTSPLPFFPDIGIFKGHHTAWPEKRDVLKCPRPLITYTWVCREIGQKYCNS